MLEIKNIKKSFGQTHVLHDVIFLSTKGCDCDSWTADQERRTSLPEFHKKADGGTMTFDDETIDLHKGTRSVQLRVFEKKTAFIFKIITCFAPTKRHCRNVTEGADCRKKNAKDEGDRLTRGH